MSGAIGPGDWVECVDAQRPALGSNAADAGAYLVLRKLYRVIRVGVITNSVKYGVGPAIEVDGPETKFPSAVGERSSCWSVQRFRPIYRPKASLIEKLSQPLNTDEFAFDCDDIGIEPSVPVSLGEGEGC